MFWKLLTSCVVLLLLWQAASAQNYCEPGLCSRGRRHIGCNNPGRFQGCNGRVVDVRPHIQHLLQLHNAARNRIAGGQLSGFPSAVQMGTMTWDDELSRIAVMNLYQCRMQHDQCRNTQRFRFAGQNLAIAWTSGTMTNQQFVQQSVNNWFNEYRQATQSDVERFQNTGGRVIGHFTAMVHERNNRIGCAIGTWRTNMNTYYLVCNYAVTNMIGSPIYRFGGAGTQCQSGRDNTYRNLCSTREIYNYNDW